jgi:hypothetical protein
MGAIAFGPNAGRIESTFAEVAHTHLTFIFALATDLAHSAVSGEREAVMPRSLPVNPSVRLLQQEAEDIINGHKSGDVTCCATLRYHFRFSRADDAEILKAQVTLQDAQHALALDYGFRSWTDLTEQADARSGADPVGGGNASAEGRQVEDERGLRQAKMEHDLSNVLYSIIGYLDLAMADLPADNPAQRNLREALNAAMRARDMVRQLRE